MWGSALAGILTIAVTRGKPRLKDLIRRLLLWRISLRWYLFILLLWPLLSILADFLYAQITHHSVRFQSSGWSQTRNWLDDALFTLFWDSDEIGWRGLALPHLQEHFPAVQSSLILGTIHTFWHLPFWTVLGELDQFGWGYWLLSWVFVLALTIFLTWLMNNTGNSILMAVLLHGCYNLVSASYLPITTIVPAYGIFTILAWIITLGLIQQYGAQRLARAGKARRLAVSEG